MCLHAGLWGVIRVVCSVRVRGAFCTSCTRGMRGTHGGLKHTVALTRGVLCTRLCSRGAITTFHQKRRCIGFHPSHMTVRSTATRVTLLRFVGTKGSISTIPTAMRYSRLVRTCGKIRRSLPSTYAAGGRMCSFLGDITSGCNVNF